MQGISSQMLTTKFWINFLFVFYKMSKQKKNGAENMWILKEAVSVISSDPLCNDDNVWFTRVPFVWWSDQAWIRYPSSVFFFIWGVTANVTCSYEAMEISSE